MKKYFAAARAANRPTVGSRAARLVRHVQTKLFPKRRDQQLNRFLLVTFRIPNQDDLVLVDRWQSIEHAHARRDTRPIHQG
ncbi:hypothetical protein, partial [Burkholderia gladioli]|uniref:hypothetical protein n=1 Tax=Burkholderia gladioli TaxID=28095 RepID=UPI003F793C8C